MRIFVINLPTASKRLEFQQAQMARLGLQFERVAAIAGQDVDDDYYLRMRTTDMRILSRNEVACFLSHLQCWEKCISLNKPVVVLEDDAVVSDSFLGVDAEIFKNMAGAAFIVSLEKTGNKKRILKKRFIVGESGFAIHDIVYAAAGAGGYVISPSAAKLCVEKARKKIGLADSFLFSVRGTLLKQLVPAVVMQLQFFGDLTELGDAAKTTIDAPGRSRATGFESFIANPMTRVRRLKSWFRTVWERHILSRSRATMEVTQCNGLINSLLATKRQLNG